MQVFFSKKGKKQAEVCVTGVAAILQKPGGAERDRRGDRSARRRECVPSPPLAIDGVRAGDRIRNTRMPVQMPIGETGGRRLFVSAGWKYHGKIHGYLDKSARVLQKAAGGPAPQACGGGGMFLRLARYPTAARAAACRKPCTAASRNAAGSVPSGGFQMRQRHIGGCNDMRGLGRGGRGRYGCSGKKRLLYCFFRPTGKVFIRRVLSPVKDGISFLPAA